MRTIDLTPRARLRYGALGGAGMCICLVLSYVAAQDTHPGASYLRASFGRAGEGLDTHSDVKIHGVKVGGVSSVHLGEDGRAVVTIRLNRGVQAPVSAEAVVVPLSVFGPKYIDLRPGQGEVTGPFLADGATITKTTDPQDLTDVAAPAVDLLDAMAPQDIATIMSALGTGLNGRGEQVGGLIDDSAELLALTARRKGDLGHLIDDTSALAQTTAAHGDEIGQITGDLNVVIPSIVGDPGQFNTLIDGLDESARTLTEILDSNPRAPSRIIDLSVPMISVLYRYRDNFPDLINGGSGILAQLAGIARAPGPHNTLLSRLTIHLDPSNLLCDAVADLCGPLPPAVPDDPGPGTKKKRGNG